MEKVVSNWVSDNMFLQYGEDKILPQLTFWSMKHSPIEKNFKFYYRGLMAILRVLQELQDVLKPVGSSIKVLSDCMIKFLCWTQSSGDNICNS